jgi:hypothetical protein
MKTYSRRPKRTLSRDSIWQDPRTLAITKLAYRGLTHRAIARVLHRYQVTQGQVSYRLGKIGLSTWAWRRGESDASKSFVEGVVEVLNRQRKREGA